MIYKLFQHTAVVKSKFSLNLGKFYTIWQHYMGRLRETFDQLFYCYQYRFHNIISTYLAINHFFQIIINNDFEQNLNFFLRFKQGFFSVPHDILVSKLPCYCCEDTRINFLMFYIEGRVKYVTYNGVPQRTVFDAILY